MEFYQQCEVCVSITDLDENLMKAELEDQKRDMFKVVLKSMLAHSDAH